jgi:hypothetical protein
MWDRSTKPPAVANADFHHDGKGASALHLCATCGAAKAMLPEIPLPAGLGGRRNIGPRVWPEAQSWRNSRPTNGSSASPGNRLAIGALRACSIQSQPDAHRGDAVNDQHYPSES